MTILSVFLIETAVIFALILLIILVFKVSSKRKAIGIKKNIEQKDVKTSSVPRKVTFWTDWKTYITIFLGYILFGIGKAQQIFNGGPFHPAIAKLPEGMLYLPIAGLFCALLVGTFVYLALRSKNSLVFAFAIVFGSICTVVSIMNFWFIPYNIKHCVYITTLHFGIPFPADPMFSLTWITLGVASLYTFARLISEKNTDFSDVLGNIVLVIAVTLFLPQLFYL